MAQSAVGEQTQLNRRGTLSSVVVDHIRRLVVEGQLQPGDRVYEVELANTLGVSRGPVREALKHLASTKLLVDAPNHGASIARLTLDQVREYYAVRELLEGRAAAEAAERMEPGEREQLLEVVAKHAEKLEAHPELDYPQSEDDWDFHSLVLKGSRNALIAQICGTDLRDVFMLLRARYGGRRRRGMLALEEHRGIAAMIAKGNREAAELLMRQHIRASMEAFVERLEAHTE